MEEQREIRMRCIEAAAKSPMVHQAGPAAGVLEVAQKWADWISPPVKPLGLPGSVTMKR